MNTGPLSDIERKIMDRYESACQTTAMLLLHYESGDDRCLDPKEFEECVKSAIKLKHDDLSRREVAKKYYEFCEQKTADYAYALSGDDRCRDLMLFREHMMSVIYRQSLN